MQLNRGSEAYEKRKLANEFIHSKFWKDYMLPILETKANSPVKTQIRSLDDSYVAAREQATIVYANDLIHTLTRLAKEFETVDVSTAEPTL